MQGTEWNGDEYMDVLGNERVKGDGAVATGRQ